MDRFVVMILFLACFPRVAFGEETSGRILLQLGHEYDTNVQRTYSSLIPDGLTRLVVKGRLQYTSEQHLVDLKYRGGLKLFHHHSSENQIVNQVQGEYHWVKTNWKWGGRLIFNDTELEVHDRDYRLLRGEFFSQIKLFSGIVMEMFVGGKYFLFKPDEYMQYEIKFTHYGPLAGIRCYLAESSGLIATVSYQVELRFFDQPAEHLFQGTFVEKDDSRLDLRHIGGLHVKHPIRYTRHKLLILEASYFVSANNSSSYGSTALWHRLQLILSMQLPLDMTLHLLGTLQFAEYADGFFVEEDLYDPDADENENSLVVRLNCPLWEGLSLVLHVGLYRNDFNSQELGISTFQRETVMLALAYDWSL